MRTPETIFTADFLNECVSFEQLMENEKKSFKDFQYINIQEYKFRRIRFLRSLNQDDKLNNVISFVMQYKPKIGIFAGSFNPFHKGHYNVLIKAEEIFDKVIIAFGQNSDKNKRTWPIPKTINNREIIQYEGLLTDVIESLGYDVTMIRGLRNSTDFQYEQNQFRYIQELLPTIKVVNIFCDKEYEHISSSGIRTLEKFGKHSHYLLD